MPYVPFHSVKYQYHDIAKKIIPIFIHPSSHPYSHAKTPSKEQEKNCRPEEPLENSLLGSHPSRYTPAVRRKRIWDFCLCRRVRRKSGEVN